MKWKPALLPAALVVPFLPLFGGEATFSKDNAHVYLLQWSQQQPRSSGGCSLIDIDLAKRTCAGIDLSKTIGESLTAITLAKEGSVLCATKSALWSYDSATGRCAKVLGAPKNLKLADLAFNPVSNTLLADCRGPDGQELFCLPQNGDRWIPVYNRRQPPVGFPVFKNDGILYFASHGDLWAGFLKRQTEPTLPALNAYSISNKSPDGWPKTIPVAELVANRFAPVAYLETENCTSDSTGLHQLAASKGFVYGNYSRLGGSGWGVMIRCRHAPPFGSPDKEWSLFGGAGADGREAIPVLQSVETIDDRPCTYLCSSRDGSLIFYIVRGGESFLIKDDAKPQPIVITGLKDLL